MSFFKETYKRLGIYPPEFHFVLGSGFNQSVDQALSHSSLQGWEEVHSCSFKDVPNLPTPTVAGHTGMYRYFLHKKTSKVICLQCGRLHGYEGYSPQDVVKTVQLPFLSGTKKFILTNMAGSLKKDIEPGHVVALTDHINLTGGNPLVGKHPTDLNDQPIGKRFPDMYGLYQQDMQEGLSAYLKKQGLKVAKGVYVGVLGPSLETAAEIQLFASWQASAVGMSTVWEAIALQQMGASLCGFSLISNHACGINKESQLSHEDMMKLVSSYSEKILKSCFLYAEKNITKGSHV